MPQSQGRVRCIAWAAVAWATVAVSAPGLAVEADSRFSAEERSHWAFQPIGAPAPPIVTRGGWDANPIDAYILARLEAAGLDPAPEADRTTLLRRLSFDLVGLPPTPDELASFVNDPAPDAYERLVDRLLASPRYGERWARHWLDLVRYAESDGFKSDDYRPEAWRYRDYVIRSLNDDKPYDRFVSEQIAGDELSPDDPDAIVATGFLRHGPYEYNQAHVRRQWEDILNEVTDVTGQVFLGLTIRCARCHDHKYDPILQADYYRLQGFFAALAPRDDIPIAAAEERDEHRRRLSQWEQDTAALRVQIESIAAPRRREASDSRKERFPKDIQAILDRPPAERSPLETQLAALAGRQLVVAEAEMAGRMKPDERRAWEDLRGQLAQCGGRPSDLPTALAASDVGPVAPATFIPGGDSGDQDNDVQPGFLTILDPSPATITPPPSGGTTGRRAALVRWLTRDDNPLVARVIVNRLWQHHFGRGLAASANDLGRQGEPPTHPELLDWLSRRLIDGGWRLKEMQRLMVTSATYRQGSSPGSRSIEVDPENRLLGRMDLRRLEAEAVRDSLLAASGELDLHAAGPSVFPALPADLKSSYAWPPSEQGQHRRSVYLAVKRNLREPLLEAFDLPDSHDSCSRRDVTTTAPQALALLNGEWSLARARAFAGRLLEETPGDERTLIARAYELALGRHASESEIASGEAFLDDQAAIIEERIAGNAPIALPAVAPHGLDFARAAAVVDFCHALLNSNEFLYVD